MEIRYLTNFKGSIGNGVGWEKLTWAAPSSQHHGELGSTLGALCSSPSQHPPHSLQSDLLLTLQTVLLCSLLHTRYRAQQMVLNKLLNTHRLAGWQEGRTENLHVWAAVKTGILLAKEITTSWECESCWIGVTWHIPVTRTRDWQKDKCRRQDESDTNLGVEAQNES